MTSQTNRPLAYETYQKLADAYAQHAETKPHNAFYDRPAMLGLMPNPDGQKILDAGCGPGIYAEALLQRGAIVESCDMSERMLELATSRLKPFIERGLVRLHQLDLGQPLICFEDQQFDGVLAPLCLDYLDDWRSLFREFRRILKPGGWFQFSCGHPAFDAEYFGTRKYFEVEQVECEWKGFGVPIVMPSYRRPMSEVVNSVVDAGFVLRKMLEPQPTNEFREADPVRYATLMHRPGFVCVQATRPAN